MKPNLSSSSLRSALLVAVCLCTLPAVAWAGHQNPVDKLSNPHALVFTDVDMARSDYRELFVRDGALTPPNFFRPIVPGLPQAQVRALLGTPLAESDGKRGHEWDYNFKFVMEPSKNYIVCQYKVVFDGEQVREQVWRRRQCQQLAEAEAPVAPPPAAPAPAPVPTQLPIRSVNFDFDDAQRRRDALAILDADVQVLKQFPALRVEIAGHTDLCGSAAYNLNLSRQRAQEVYDYLVAQGIAPSRLVGPLAYGETRPKVQTPQTYPQCRNEENRRTELNLVD